ncbi:MAG: PQQ-binding-like beta-propeller repeat protein, partial [Planctomycetota bacterium]
RSTAGRTSAISDGSYLWIQFPKEIRAIDLSSTEELWRRVVPEQDRESLPRTIFKPVRLGTKIIASMGNKIEALDGVTGNQLWSVDIDQILGVEEKPQAIRALSAPCIVPGGVIVVAVENQGHRLEAFASYIDESGRIGWVRHLGESTGATWLALGAAPAPVVAGTGRIHWATGRGTIVTLRTSDGAIEWLQDLSGPSRFGLRHHLIQNPPGGPPLHRNGSRLFLLPPGAPGITILSERDGQILETIPIRSAQDWALSESGDSLLVIEGNELLCWSCPADGTPRFLWRNQLPETLVGQNTDVIAAKGQGWWVSAGDAILSYREDGKLATIQGMGLPADEIMVLKDGLLTRSESDIQFLIETKIDNIAPWKNIIAGQLDPTELLDLSGNTPLQKALRRTVELQLERSDVVFSEIERVTLETALIAAHLRPEDRITLGWKRAVYSQKIGALQCATMICTLLLNESPRSLENTRVESLQKSWVPAGMALTHLLLELDQMSGGKERIAQREARAQRDAKDLNPSSSPAGWQSLARMRPGCPTGRQARLAAAESYYRVGDLDRCLRQIDLLIVREPNTDEALVGKLRRSEVLREQGRLTEALSEIESLNAMHGNRVMTQIVDGIERETTLGQRLQELRAEISKLPQDQKNHPGLPLQRAWAGRLELDQTRSTEIVPLSTTENYGDDPRVLILTSESAQMLDSTNGILLWETDLGRDPVEVRDGIILTRRDLPSRPLTFDDSGVIFHDRNQIWKLRLEDGIPIWNHRMPAEQEIPDQEIRIEQSCAAAGFVILVTEDEEITALDATNGHQIWQQRRRGPLFDDPIIQEQRLIIGYSVPDKVEVLSLNNGQIIQELVLEQQDGALASVPILVPGGFIVSLERGSVRRYRDDGSLLWETDLPHILSELHISPQQDQLVCELFWTADRPSLLGIDMDTGKIGWQRKLPQDRRRITSLSIDGEELLLVCGDFQNRVILKLRSTIALSLQEIPTAELEWTHQLAPAYDSVELRPQGDWVVVADRLRAEVVILDRSTGTPLTSRQGIKAVSDHIKSLGRLHHASVIGETLLTVSSRGAAGFRSITPRKNELSAWQSMLKSNNWQQEAIRLLEMQESQLAVDLLENTITNLEIDPHQRAIASWLLEGAERQLAMAPQKDHEIPKMRVAPIIDGSLEEPWNATRGIPLTLPRHVRGIQGPGEPRIPWRDLADLSGRVFLGWSEEGLHISVDIDDDNVTTHQRDAKSWIGDCLILLLDTKGDGGIRPRSDDQVLTLAFVPPRPQPVPEEGAAEEAGEAPPPFEEEEEEKPEGDHIVVRRADGTGAVYEMTIPWTSIAEQREELNSVPWPGMRMRIGIAVTDDDTGRGATKYLGLTPGMVLHKNLDRIWEGCSPDLLLPVRLGR